MVVSEWARVGLREGVEQRWSLQDGSCPFTAIPTLQSLNIPARTPLKISRQCQTTPNPAAHRITSELKTLSHSQPTQRKDRNQRPLLPLWQPHPPDQLNRQQPDQKVRRNVDGRQRVLQRLLVDAVVLDRARQERVDLVPQVRERDALQARRHKGGDGKGGAEDEEGPAGVDHALRGL